MSVAGLTDVGTDLWGGYCPAIPPSQLPQGASPNCQDVIFPEACVRSRPRLSSFFPSLGGNPTVNGMKTYANALGNIMLAWDSLGNLWEEAVPNSLTLIKGGGVPNLFMNSTSLFGREYIAFGNAKGGQDIPRQFDGTHYDRVSQIGPAVAPNATDDNTAYPLSGVPAAPASQPAAGVAITSISQSGNLVTVVMPSVAGFQINGENIVIAGAPAGYNGTFPVTWIPGTNNFTYVLGATGLLPGAGGTASSQAAQFDLTIPPLGVAGFPGARAAALALGPVYFPIGTSITSSGIGVGGYNGTWKVIGYSTWFQFSGGFNHFYLAIIVNLNVTGLANSNGGQIIANGNIVAGLRGVTVAFITRQGLITCPAPPNFWTAAGAKRVFLSQIATGPPNIIARLLLFTTVITPPATTGTFYSLPTGSQQVVSAAMQISDNTTTSITIDFLDAILAAGFNGEYLFSQVELGECAAVNSYNSRTVWLGERNKVKADGGGGGFINLTFDGGFSNPGGMTNYPLGWTPDPVQAAGGASAVAQGHTAYWGDALEIIGDGLTFVRGKFTQSAAVDYLNNPILFPNTGYSVRARVLKGGGLAQGTLQINLTSAIGNFTTLGLSLAAGAVTPNYVEYVAVLLTPQAAIPADLTLQIYADGTPTAGGYFDVDCIEIFPTNTPFNTSLARISHANNPESFDGLLDVVQIAAPGGSAGIQSLRASWQIRTNLYLAKDHYLGYVTDDGQNEPASWVFTEVSNTIGCCGPNAWDGTEEWVVFAERSGAYITTGSDPVKVMQEIQEDVSGTGKPNWNATNWNAGYTVWTRIDRLNKRVLTGLPINGATAPNLVFQMDYKFEPTGEAISGAQAPTYSAFTGRILVHGSARKWAPWNVTANSCALIERPDGTAQVFLGNGTGNGKIYETIDCAVQGSDDGVAVNDFYETYGNPSKNEEEAMQLGEHMKYTGYLSIKASGNGFLSIQATSPFRTTAIRAATLSASQDTPDIERKVSLNGERIRYRVGTNAVGNWFQLERIIPAVEKHPTMPVRGLSA